MKEMSTSWQRCKQVEEIKTATVPGNVSLWWLWRVSDLKGKEVISSGGQRPSERSEKVETKISELLLNFTEKRIKKKHLQE